MSTQSCSVKRKNDLKDKTCFVKKNMFCWILANRNLKIKDLIENEGWKQRKEGGHFPLPFRSLTFSLSSYFKSVQSLTVGVPYFTTNQHHARAKVVFHVSLS
jgi:hypothetical protein